MFYSHSEERTWRDLSFCLSQLQYNDRALVNLAHNFNLFSESCCYDAVNDNIMSIINTARKNSGLKAEAKQVLDDLEGKIKDIRTKGIESKHAKEGEDDARGVGDTDGAELNGNGAATPAPANNDNDGDAETMSMPPPTAVEANSRPSRWSTRRRVATIAKTKVSKPKPRRGTRRRVSRPSSSSSSSSEDEDTFDE